AGELPWTKARELVSVATPANETLWLNDARRLGRRALERKVKASRPRPPRKRQDPPALFAAGEPEARRSDAEAAAPLRVTLNFTPDQYARWEALIEQLRKDGQLDPREELVLAALATRPRGRVKQAATVIIRRCPDCGAQAYVTSRGELPAPGGDPPRTLTPALRRKILARDGHRCQGLGCTSTRFLEVHHQKSRANGGTNAPSNLITLCSACHQLHHERGLARAVVAGASARGSP
ncbi:HNH endonuclease, partial [bacterium]|nr:HNH endonuclease [bacterium]